MTSAIYLPAVTRGCLSNTLSVTFSSLELDEESLLSISSLSVSSGIFETKRFINYEKFMRNYFISLSLEMDCAAIVIASNSL
jgi:hypothetical protein